MIYDLTMIALGTIGIAGAIWLSWRMHKARKEGKLFVVGIIKHERTTQLDQPKP